MLVRDPLIRDSDKRQFSQTQLRRSRGGRRHQMIVVEEERSRYTDPVDAGRLGDRSCLPSLAFEFLLPGESLLLLAPLGT